MKNIINMLELNNCEASENFMGNTYECKKVDSIINDVIKKLKVFDDFITQCEYCTMYDFNSQICKQNGCKDMEDFKFFKEIE